jgi:3-oxoacyl-[acyl-carrier protein] reductase
MELGLRGRVCVITGASGGIGRATAELLAAEGAGLLLVGRDMERLEAAAAACQSTGAQTVLIRVEDVTRPAAAAEIVRAAQTGLGGIDVLVNNAGGSQARALEQLSDADWQAQWELHVMAPMRLMRAAAPIMAAGGWGRIVNVCSSAGRRPSGSLDMPYSVTKAAQLSLSRAFAEQYAAQGVLVNAVNPGPVAGAMWQSDGGLADQIAAHTGRSREDVLAATTGRIPTGRYGTADEVAAVIAFLCSAQAANVAGAAWSVDGGAVPSIF